MRKTVHLNATEFGVYMFFLSAIYSTGLPLPTDEERLKLIARLPDPALWPEIKRTVLQHYFYKTADGWFKNKIGEIMTEQSGKARRAKAGADARWKKTPDSDPYGIAEANAQANAKTATKQMPGASQSESESESESEPDTTTKASTRVRGRLAKRAQQLIDECTDIFGAKEMGQNIGLWILRAKEDPDKLHRVLAEVRRMQKEGLEIRKLPAAATDLWKRFATH